MEWMGLRGIEQVDLVRLTGEKQQTISRILSGQIKNPGIDKMEKIADALDVPLEYLRPDFKGVSRILRYSKQQGISVPDNGRPQAP